jgi:hypothetical protein
VKKSIELNLLLQIKINKLIIKIFLYYIKISLIIMDYSYSYNSKKKAYVYCIGNKYTKGPPGPPGESATVYGQISYVSNVYRNLD